MPEASTQKNNVSLSDYGYRRDIENRLLTAELSIEEVETLKELLDGPLTHPIAHLASILSLTPKKLLLLLTKLEKTGLFTLQGENVVVDKEMRKYYEAHIQKFDETFEPDMEFFQGLLSKVPIHILPTWYEIPSFSVNIFKGIVDNYLLTPKTYEKYLKGLKFKDPALNNLLQDILKTPNFMLRAQTLMKKHSLTREKFEEYVLTLEYSLVCCLRYQRNGDVWEEVIAPFREWREYVCFQEEKLPKSIKNVNDIKVNALHAHSLDIYQNALHATRDNPAVPYSEKDIREIGRGLKRVLQLGWVYFDDFLASLSVPLGPMQPVQLQCRGKKWRYVLPSYTPEDAAFIRYVVMEVLFESGMVSIGKLNGKECFCVTPFGCKILED